MKNDKWHTDEQYASPLVPIEKTEIYYECPVCGHGSSSKATIENCIKRHTFLDNDIITILEKDWSDDDFAPPIQVDNLWEAVYTDDHDNPIGIDIKFLNEDLHTYKDWLLRTQNKVEKLLSACNKENEE